MHNPFSESHYGRLARVHTEQFRQATPFPHIVFDNFLPEPIAQDCAAKFPDLTKVGFASEKPHKGGVVVRKFGYFGIPPGFEHIYNCFISKPFIDFLEALTGEVGLMGDPTHGGGGVSEITQGGFLRVHADYNLFKKHDKPLLRRVNLIYFLNKDWQEEWGGHLELWRQGDATPAVRIFPGWNRCAIFQASDTSFHGHPHALACPPERRRRTMAFYYYLLVSEEDAPPRHGTLYIDVPTEPKNP